MFTNDFYLDRKINNYKHKIFVISCMVVNTIIFMIRKIIYSCFNYFNGFHNKLKEHVLQVT